MPHLDESEAEEFAGAVCGPEGTFVVPWVHGTQEHPGLAPHRRLG